MILVSKVIGGISGVGRSRVAIQREGEWPSRESEEGPKGIAGGGGDARLTGRQERVLGAHNSIDPSVHSLSATQRPLGWKR